MEAENTTAVTGKLDHTYNKQPPTKDGTYASPICFNRVVSLSAVRGHTTGAHPGHRQGASLPGSRALQALTVHDVRQPCLVETRRPNSVHVVSDRVDGRWVDSHHLHRRNRSSSPGVPRPQSSGRGKASPAGEGRSWRDSCASQQRGHAGCLHVFPYRAAAAVVETTAKQGDVWEHRSIAPATICCFLMLQGIGAAVRLPQSARDWLLGA